MSTCKRKTILYYFHQPSHTCKYGYNCVLFCKVRIQDGSLISDLVLDDQLIEFGTAIEDSDLVRALSYLERLEHNARGSGKGLWATLARLSVDANELHIASRCYAALGDVAKVRFLADTLKMAQQVSRTTSIYQAIKLVFRAPTRGFIV